LSEDELRALTFSISFSNAAVNFFKSTPIFSKIFAVWPIGLSFNAARRMCAGVTFLLRSRSASSLACLTSCSIDSDIGNVLLPAISRAACALMGRRPIMLSTAPRTFSAVMLKSSRTFLHAPPLLAATMPMTVVSGIKCVCPRFVVSTTAAMMLLMEASS